MTEKECCANCKYLDVIISQMADYICDKNNNYITNISDVCDGFEQDTRTLSEKEEVIW